MTKVGSIMRGRPGDDVDQLNNSATFARNKSRLFSQETERQSFGLTVRGHNPDLIRS